MRTQSHCPPEILRSWKKPTEVFLHKQVCCVSTETKLKEYPAEEKEVLKILTQVNVTRRECEIVRVPLSLPTYGGVTSSWNHSSVGIVFYDGFVPFPFFGVIIALFFF